MRKKSPSSLSQLLWAANQSTVEHCIADEFLARIADGTLARKEFAKYVANDVLFLEHYAAVMAVAQTRCDSSNENLAEAFKVAFDDTRKELKKQRRRARSLRVTPEKTTLHESGRAFADFLLRKALYSPIPELLAAVTPCLILYAHLGNRFAKASNFGRSHAFYEWIRTYSDEVMQQAAEAWSARLDEVRDSPSVRKAYRDALVHERQFFAAALNSDEAKVRSMR